MMGRLNCELVFLLVASVIIGCLSDHHEPNESGTEYNGDIGFLLYLPANLESGATVQAYIETNTTEPFTAELNFIHSNEDRHFYSSARIENGEGSIDIEVPKVDYWYGSVNFTGVFEVSQKTITGSRNNIYIYRDVQKATFIETDKPLYKPGQEVKFRLITIDSDFKPETSNISKIQIESPTNIRLAQWRNVERPDGLVDLSFQLISEPALGIYNIKAYVDDNWISQPFKVDEYVLPKFEVTVRADSYILINAEEFSFQVCAKYTYGQPVRGSLSGSVGKVVKENYYYYYRQRESTQLGEEQDELELTDAVEFIAELDNQGCYETTIDVTEMNLSSYDTPNWKTSLAVKATITEASTGNEFTETYAGTKLETTALHINLESASTFKPGIPYQGRIKVTYPDDKPAPNEVLNITARVDRETVHQDEATTDSEGIVNFEIPFAVMDKSIRLTVTAVAYPTEHSEDSYSMYQPSSYINLDPAYSNTGRYIQILPVTETVNAGEDVTVQVLYTSDDSAVSSDFKFQFVARNKLIDAGATHIGESRRRRVAILETECQQQVREAAEKGALGSFSPDCDDNGLFMKRQCHASTRRCWCVNPETGLEVTSGVTPECEAEEESGPIEVPIGELGPPDAFNECQEGFSFAPGVKKCVRIAEETECQRQVREADEKGALLGGHQPACHEDGSFLPEQCHSSTGYCWCVDTATGLEVPETQTGPTEKNVDCEEPVEVLTICQRLAQEAQFKSSLVGGDQPACHEDGSFLPEQCHRASGYCWCVDTATGLEVPETQTGPTEENVDCEAEGESGPIEIPIGELGPPDAFNECQEGFSFAPGVKKCVRTAEETDCQRQVREADEKGPLLGGRQPACHEDGSFLPEQCHGSTGYCWCVDTATGLEVPETRTGPTEENVDCEEPVEVLTVCQRLAQEAQFKSSLVGGDQPACHEDGSFLPEQCHGSTGNCWCVDTATGLEVPETRTGPTEENVDCEEPVEVLTECQRQAQEAQGKGPLLGGRQPACHEDGSFLPEQCHGSTGNCWCVDTATGLEVPETRTGPTEENVDCEEPVEVLTECQRQVQEVQGKGPLVGGRQPACHEDGSFLPEQCHGSTGYCWCVDMATGLEVPETKTGPTEKNVDCEESPTTPSPTISVEEPIVHVDPQALQEATFSIRITPGLSPEAQLLVYYTSPEGEIIADSVTIKVNEAFENEVHLEFSEPEVTPGSETTLKVSAENGSLCGIGIVDKSVYVLGGENKLTPKKLFAVFDLSVRTAYYGDYCSRGYYRYRFKRDILPYPGYGYNTVTYTDSSEAFKNSGLMTVTNFDLEVAPCTYHPAIAYSVARAGGEELFDSTEGDRGAAKQDGEDTIRSYFPSTWLWTLQRVSETPAEMQLPVPDTITDWIANGFCTNVKYGVGIAPPVTLRAFQPFFLSMSLPYSIIRTEKTPIKVSVFNYLEQCLVVRITLEENEDLVLSGDSMYTVAVPAGDVTTVTFKVAVFVLGEIPLQVTAESISDDEFLCGNEAVAGAAGTSDTVLRNLKVKPEGEPETRTESVYFCLEDDETYNKHISLKIPPQHVPGTAVGEITVTGDLVGNSLSNVEDMLRMPYGCGEQNLLSMVPNIVALQYLQSVGEATPEITVEAKKNILSGYQRELNYRRTDNSYSAFGNSNPSGSTFLTAFVVRTYAHAQKFVEVDEEDLFVTIQWLRGIQEVDGSFRTVGYLAHKAMKGGVNNNVTLAAYVVSTFLEAGYGTEDKTVAAAFKYLNSQLDSLEDTYSMALLAYAYALAGMEEFDQVYEKLQESAVNTEGTRHWESNREGLPSYTSYYQDSAKSQNIEMTAYVLRAMILYDIPDLEVEGSYIARWLVAQRNPRGGFSSTQDTVIGLTALAEFSSMGSGSPEITLTMNIRGGETLQYEVTTDNRYVLQQGFFEDFPAEISISAEGTGCALYTVSGDYYIKKEKQLLDPFSLSIKTKVKRPLLRKRRDTGEAEEETEEAAPCDKFTISISARYNGEDGASNMAIINVRPVSGFVFDKDSLESLKMKYDFIRRYEINEDTITFYFDEITNDDMEFEFDVIKDFDVEDAKPAFITILDYYENGLKVAEEFEFVCVDEEATESPSTTYTTPVSPSGFPSSSSTEAPGFSPLIADFDECLTPDVCGGPEYVCINYPGTYECICADGYALDETEENCVAIPSCPVCAMDLPAGSEESVCGSDFIKVMKVRVDGTLRPLSDLLNNMEIRDRSYIDIEIDENCPCDLLSGGGRIIVIATNDHISPSSGKNAEKILLDDSVFVVDSISSVKKDIGKVLIDC